MGVYAIISDIHGNEPALLRVLNEIRFERKIPLKNVRDLGDIVGYGPFVNQCVEMIDSLGIPSVMGNHDRAVLDDAGLVGFNGAAAAAAIYARNELTRANMDYLRKKPYTFSPDIDAKYGFECVHGSLVAPERFCYIEDKEIGKDDENNVSPKETFKAMTAPVLFIGHSHIQGIFKEDPEELKGYKFIDIFEGVYELKHGVRYIVNVGSVGQPRGHKPDPKNSKACFVVYDTDANPAKVEVVRVGYDIQKMMQSVREAFTLNMKELNAQLKKDFKKPLPESHKGQPFETVGDYLAKRLELGI